MSDYIEFTKEEIKEFHKKVASNVAKIRKQKGFSQLKLSEDIGHSSVSTIGKIEAHLDDKHFNIEHLYKMAKVLKVDIRKFFE